MNEIIFSHGFGVRKDSRGMFADIAESLDGFDCDLFDYNELLSGGDVRVRTLSEQAKILDEHIAAAGEEGVTLICHSQGCIVASLADTSRVKKVILLAPPVEMSAERFMRKFGSREGVSRDDDGTLKIPRSDGSTTYIGADYIDELDAIEPLKGYRRLANEHDVTIIRATADNILGMTDLSTVTNTRIIDIEADHDFTGEARAELIRQVAQIVRKKEAPDIIKQKGLDFSWDAESVWPLDVPTEDIDAGELAWHFDIPFWWTEPDGSYDLSPRQVLDNPQKYTYEYSHILAADTSYPIDIMWQDDRWVILDGLHRLVKLVSIEGKTRVAVRKIPRSMIPLITKQK